MFVAGGTWVGWAVIQDGLKEWAGVSLVMPGVSCSEVWSFQPPPARSTRKTLRALRAYGVGLGEYMTRFAFYLSCLFNFVF